jgi:hypothetical protein
LISRHEGRFAMIWECSECGGQVERARPPVVCRECGTAGVIHVPVKHAAEHDESLREAWLRAGMDPRPRSVVAVPERTFA